MNAPTHCITCYRNTSGTIPSVPHGFQPIYCCSPVCEAIYRLDTKQVHRDWMTHRRKIIMEMSDYKMWPTAYKVVSYGR